MRIAGKELYTSASIGIAFSHERYRNPEELLRDADVAMYRAKAAGRQRFALFDEGLHEDALRQLELEGDLRRAVHRGRVRALLPADRAPVRRRSGRLRSADALAQPRARLRRARRVPGARPKKPARCRRSTGRSTTTSAATSAPSARAAPMSASTCRRATCARTPSASACWRLLASHEVAAKPVAPGSDRRRAAGKSRPGAAVPDASCAPPACRPCSTISAPAFRRCPTCTGFRCTA